MPKLNLKKTLQSILESHGVNVNDSNLNKFYNEFKKTDNEFFYKELKNYIEVNPKASLESAIKHFSKPKHRETLRASLTPVLVPEEKPSIWQL